MTTWAIIYFLIDVSSMNDEIEEKIMNIVGRVSLMNDWGGRKLFWNGESAFIINK